jgi:hypothetical protein
MEKIDFDESSPLQTYAYKWLKSRGLFDEDSDYNGMLGKAILELVKVFSNCGYSGFAAVLVKEMSLRLLADFQSGKEV